MRKEAIRRTPSLACAGLAVGLSLMLTGCFATDHPLIDAATADAPFADGTRLAEYSNCGGSPVAELLACKGYIKSGVDRLNVKDGVTSLLPLSVTIPALNPQMPGGDQPLDLLFKRVGPDLFAVQLKAPGDDGHWMYAMMRHGGASFYVYLLQCEQNGDARYVRSGALNQITNLMLQPTCEPASLEGLGRIMADRLANDPAPDKRFDVLK